MHFSNKDEIALERYNKGTTDLYPLLFAPDQKVLLVPHNRPPLCRASRPTPRRHFAYKRLSQFASGKAGGRCAPRPVTAVLGLAARGRPAAPVRSRSARPPTKRGREHGCKTACHGR